jgi:hypothetical protein
MLLLSPAERVQQVLLQLQKTLAHIDSSATVTSAKGVAATSKDGSENCDKIAVMLYSFSEVCSNRVHQIV